MNNCAGEQRPCILLVDDHPLVCKYLATLLKSEGMEICGETDNIEDTLARVKRRRPDLMIVDISLGGDNGLTLIKRIRRDDPDIRILVLSSHDETLYARRSLDAGAHGYINKEEDPAKIMAAIKTLLAGNIYLSDPMRARVSDGFSGADVASVNKLSNRELQVFELIGKGRSTSEIAKQLHLSVKTIETHREKIKKKLQLQSGNELAREAMQWILEQG